MTENKQEKDTGREVARVYGPVMDMQQAIEMFNQITNFCKEKMKRGVDYGVIPGTSKQKDEDGKERERLCLFKPGAEKLCLWFGFEPDYEEKMTIMPPISEGAKPIITIDGVMKLRDRQGIIRGWGVSNCNSDEKKYRDRQEWLFENKIPEGLNIDELECEERTSKRTGNPYKVYKVLTLTNPNDVLNTLKKMAFKRAFIGATLMGTGTSEVFTQDVIDEDDLNRDQPVEQAGDKKSKAKAGDMRTRARNMLGKCLESGAVKDEGREMWEKKITEAKSNKDLEAIGLSLKAFYDGHKAKSAPIPSEPAPNATADIKARARQIADDLLNAGQLDRDSHEGWMEKIANAPAQDAAGVMAKLEALAKEGVPA